MNPADSTGPQQHTGPMGARVRGRLGPASDTGPHQHTGPMGARGRLGGGRPVNPADGTGPIDPSGATGPLGAGARERTGGTGPMNPADGTGALGAGGRANATGPLGTGGIGGGTARRQPTPWEGPEPGTVAGPTPYAGITVPPAAGPASSDPARRDRVARLRPEPGEEHDDYEDDADPEPPARPVDPRRRRRTGLWLTFAGLLLMAWSATAVFVDSASPLLTVPAGLLPLVTIFALPVIAIGVGGKHFVSTAIAALAALLPWAMVAGYASSRDLPSGTLSTVRVMTVEGAGGQADASSIVSAATDYSADVVIVTGLDTTLVHDLTVAGLDKQTPPVWVSADGDTTEGIGIWSRLTVSGLKEVDGFSRPAASGVLEAGEARVGLTVAQLDGSPLLPGRGWRSDLKKLAAQKVDGAETGSFLTGGLNTSSWQPAFRALEKAGWEDAADVAGKGLRPTWPSWSPLPLAPVDHLLVDDGIGVSSAATVNITGSSHRALVTSLEVPTG